MAAPTPTRPARDRFDDIPRDMRRVGAHRSKAHWARGLITVAWAAGAIVVLSTAGLWGLAQVNSDFEFALPIPSAEDAANPDTGSDNTPAEEAEPVLDPKVSITVLNGTPTQGWSNTVGDYLVAQGWGGAALGIGARASASTNDVETTAVIYNDPANEGAARALLETLGVGELKLANTYPASPIAVLVGSDFELPAG